MRMPDMPQAIVISVPGQSIARDVVPGGDYVVLVPERYKRGHSPRVQVDSIEEVLEKLVEREPIWINGS